MELRDFFFCLAGSQGWSLQIVKGKKKSCFPGSEDLVTARKISDLSPQQT